MTVIGIDLGGTKIAAAVFDKEAKILLKEVCLLNGAGGQEAGALVAQTVKALIEKYGGPIDAIGACVPGIAYSRTGTVWAPNIPGWTDFPLKAVIEEVAPGIPVLIESDRTCYILGEEWQGAANGCDNAIYIAVGTGIGAGILLDGHIVHGAGDIVGATGWMALQYPYDNAYDECGCFEHYASGNGIGLQARKAAHDAGYAEMWGKPVADITSHDVFAQYDNGDPIAVKVLNKAIEMWGMGAANLVSLFNPEKIIFGGGVFGPAAKFMDRIYSEALKWGQPISMRNVEFLASAVQGEAALIGAASLALRSH
ncbi:MAG: ROK family protein [Muribaculaceae bacterium]|nr:ROK family protein [Muribaculaceae bacterium]